jgi:hypothetical protein
MHIAELSHAGADPGGGVRDLGGRRLEFVPAHYSHIEALVADLRPEDAETVRLAGSTPVEAYDRMLNRSMHAVTATLDGVPAAMWGDAVDSFLLPDKAHLWLLIPANVHRPAHIIARGALPFVEAMQACYGRLVTTVAWGHERDHRWVRWLGFRRAPGEDKRVGQAVFLGYERGADYGC